VHSQTITVHIAGYVIDGLGDTYAVSRTPVAFITVAGINTFRSTYAEGTAFKLGRSQVRAFIDIPVAIVVLPVAVLARRRGCSQHARIFTPIAGVFVEVMPIR